MPGAGRGRHAVEVSRGLEEPRGEVPDGMVNSPRLSWHRPLVAASRPRRVSVAALVGGAATTPSRRPTVGAFARSRLRGAAQALGRRVARITNAAYWPGSISEKAGLRRGAGDDQDSGCHWSHAPLAGVRRVVCPARRRAARSARARTTQGLQGFCAECQSSTHGFVHIRLMTLPPRGAIAWCRDQRDISRGHRRPLPAPGDHDLPQQRSCPALSR